MTKTKTCFDPNDLMHINFYIYVSKKHSRGRGGGVTCHDFSYGCAAGTPGPNSIHILGEVKKKQTNSYTFISRIVPINILFGWKRYPIDILLMRKWYPIHILGSLKSIPHSSRTSAYTFIVEVTPPRGNALCKLKFYTQKCFLVKTLNRIWWKLKKKCRSINVFIDEILLQII